MQFNLKHLGLKKQQKTVWFGEFLPIRVIFKLYHAKIVAGKTFGKLVISSFGN